VESPSTATATEAADTKDRAVDLTETAVREGIGKAERIGDRVKADQADIGAMPAVIPMETVLTAGPVAAIAVLLETTILTAIVRFDKTVQSVRKDKNEAKDINGAVRG
jgi:hypothetical protein